MRPSADALLAWYDRHHRELPWRVGPVARRGGVAPDPYRVWLSEVMLQQTTVAAVIGYFDTFITRWPTVSALAAADDADVMAAWAGLGYYARARNLLKCARVVTHEFGGRFPVTEQELKALPGIGPYTAAAIAAIAFDAPAVVVDGNVERVMARIFAETTPLPKAKSLLKAHAATLTPETRPGDYAQAAMDLGATVCTPRRPACGICPWHEGCAGRALGIAETLPTKAPRRAKPVRFGHVWCAFSPHGIVTRRRPESGLLGGMLALPSSDWSEVPDPAPPFPSSWQAAGEVRHTFTHFHLRLTVHCATITSGRAVMSVDAAEEAMPTVFAKALRLARGWHANLAVTPGG